MDLFSITFDIDWAPDFAIFSAARMLIENNVKSTWFVTHASPAIDFLKSRPDLFELGLHPNFLPGSSHGATEDEVIANVKLLVPGSKISRSHALVQSSPLLYKMAKEHGIQTDLSLFLWCSPGITPHYLHFNDLSVLRIPYFWEDDTNAYDSNKTWDFADRKYHVTGLKIFNFHPMYVYLNADTMNGYEQLKKIRYLADLTEGETIPFVNKGIGTGTLFTNMVESMKNYSHTVTEITDLWLHENATQTGTNFNIQTQ